MNFINLDMFLMNTAFTVAEFVAEFVTNVETTRRVHNDISKIGR